MRHPGDAVAPVAVCAAPRPGDAASGAERACVEHIGDACDLLVGHDADGAAVDDVVVHHQVAGRFGQDNASDLRVGRAADIDLVVADRGMIGADADAEARARLIANTGEVDRIAGDDGIGRGEVVGVAIAVDLNRGGVEVDEDVVADEHRRGAGGRADGAAAVGHRLLECVVGHNMLAGGQHVERCLARARIADGDRARVAEIVPHDLDETGSTFPTASAHVLDAAIEHRCVFRVVVVVECVAGAVGDRAVLVNDGLGVVGGIGVARTAATRGIEALARHAGRMAVVDQHPFGAVNPHGRAKLDEETPHVGVAAGAHRAHLPAFGEPAEALEAQFADGHRCSAAHIDAGAGAVADVEDGGLLVLAFHGDTIGVGECESGGEAIAPGGNEYVAALAHGAVEGAL